MMMMRKRKRMIRDDERKRKEKRTALTHTLTPKPIKSVPKEKKKVTC